MTREAAVDALINLMHDESVGENGRDLINEIYDYFKKKMKISSDMNKKLLRDIWELEDELYQISQRISKWTMK